MKSHPRRDGIGRPSEISSLQAPRVLIVRDRFTAGGGIHHYYNAIAPHLTTQVVFTDVGKPNYPQGSRVHLFLRITILRLLKDWIVLIAKIVSFRPAIVHVNPGLDPEEGCRALNREAVNILLARTLGCRVLVFWRGWYNPSCGSREFPGGTRSLRCSIYQLADAHIVLAQRFRDDLVQWRFKAPIYVETTVVGDEFLSEAVQIGDKAASRTNLLFLSRVEVAKGLFELLEAYQVLKQRNPAYTLRIAGSGPDLEAVKERASLLQLKDVSFLGFVAGDTKMKCYREAGIFCFLSYTEGMPNAVLEAMAMGLPVVSSDAGGLRDILRNGQTGYVVHPDINLSARHRFNLSEVVEAVERLTRDGDLYSRVSEYNSRLARDRFAAATVGKRLGRIYQSLVEGRIRALQYE